MKDQVCALASQVPSQGKKGGAWEKLSLGLTHTFLQTSVSLKRIQNFLIQDELDPQCVERKTISPGPETLCFG